MLRIHRVPRRSWPRGQLVSLVVGLVYLVGLAAFYIGFILLHLERAD